MLTHVVYCYVIYVHTLADYFTICFSVEVGQTNEYIVTSLRGYALSVCYSDYRPQMKLRKGNVFTPVSHSVHGGGMHGTGAMHNGRRAWQGGHGRGDVRGRRDGHCCGRYASYWNTFLLYFKFNKTSVARTQMDLDLSML